MTTTYGLGNPEPDMRKMRLNEICV